MKPLTVTIQMKAVELSLKFLVVLFITLYNVILTDSLSLRRKAENWSFF